MSHQYDKELINREVIAVCDHYLESRRGEGRRQTYPCPACGDRNFEVDPQFGYAGCFDAACEIPKTTDALGIIAYFEGFDQSGKGFIECLKKGYEILGIDDPEERDNPPAGASSSGHSAGRGRAMTPRKKKAMTPRRERGGAAEDGIRDASTSSEQDTGPQWGAAVSEPAASRGTVLEQPIQAWQEHPDGSRSPIAAVVVEDQQAEAREDDSGELEEAELATELVTEPAADTEHKTGRTDERQKAHEVFEELLKLCRREDRDESFFKGRGLDTVTIEEGRFGSISKERCNYVLNKLRRKFSDEELLSVPGFRKAHSGQLRFSLYGDYALMPYYDGEGYIRTVEGRFTGEEMGDYDKKYKALLNSAVHLYVHPRFKPDEVVAICEGAIGAMVAARYGFAVASIKGYRNYRRRADGDGAAYDILPEFDGVDFAGKVVVYIPDLDVKPQTREEAFSLVPEACQWMIQRQGGVAKVAMLPEGAKDLDAWILSLDEEEREKKIRELLSGAVHLEQWKEEHLAAEQPDLPQDGSQQQGTRERIETSGAESVSTEQAGEQEKPDAGSARRQVFGDADAEPEEHEPRTGCASGGGQQPLEGFEDTQDDQAAQNTSNEGESQPASSRREYGWGAGEGSEAEGQTNQGKGGESREEGEDTGNATEPNPDEGQIRFQEEQTEDDTTEMEPVTEKPDYGPQPAAFEVSKKGEWALAALVYTAATILLTILTHVLIGRYVGWLAPPVWWEAGLAAFVAIWITAGFRTLRKSRKAKRLRRHIEGTNV